MKSLIDTIVVPMVGRIGSVIAGTLVGYGIAADHANAIGLGVGAAIAVGIELTARYFKERAQHGNE